MGHFKNKVCINPLCVLWSSEGDSGDNSIVVYYESEFDVPVPERTTVDEAIESLEPPAESEWSQQGQGLLKPSDTLNISSIISQGLTAHRSMQFTLFYRFVCGLLPNQLPL